MAEQPAGEKNLPATPRKIEQAREKGNVAKSQDLSSSVLLLLSILGLWLLGPMIFAQMLGITQHYLSNAHALVGEVENMQGLLIQGLIFMAPVVLPFMVILMIGGFVTNVLQVGFLYSLQAIQPKLEKINPLKGFKRYFSLRTLVELIKSLLKLTLVTYIVYLSMRNRTPELLVLMHTTAWGVGMVIWDMIFTIWWRVALAMLLLGLMDFGFQRWQHGQDLRMTSNEMKEEMKQLEGDPQIRQRIRQIQRQMAMQRMMQEIPEADVVITNPTTYAVALRYNLEEMDAPTLTAKGARLQAQRIREIAIEHNVPIVERPELARSIFRTMEVGQSVPEDLFRGVAEVLAYIYEIDRREDKVRERQASGMALPA